MLNPKIHITIQGEVGSGRSLIARKIYDTFIADVFEGLIPVLADGDGIHYYLHGIVYTEKSLLKYIDNEPILLISVRSNGQQNQNPNQH